MAASTSNPGKPTFGSAGFIVLDIVESVRDQAPIHLYFGGTVGNITVILSALGWASYPLSRLPRNDPAFINLADDLKRFGVQTDFINLTPAAPLPALVQRKRADGSEQPIFTLRCPRCGSRWRGWSPVTSKTAGHIADSLPRFDLFLIDRHTRGMLDLATGAKQRGAQVVFEPASLNTKIRAEVTRFQEALALADILKYSAKQFPEIDDKAFPRRPSIEIQTLGQDGLRFRQRQSDQAMSDWKQLSAFDEPDVVDACGAGDWLTAVLIHLIGPGKTPDDAIQEMLLAAQAASAWACRFPAARGGMYSAAPGPGRLCLRKNGRSIPAAVT